MSALLNVVANTPWYVVSALTLFILAPVVTLSSRLWRPQPSFERSMALSYLGLLVLMGAWWISYNRGMSIIGSILAGSASGEGDPVAHQMSLATTVPNLLNTALLGSIALGLGTVLAFGLALFGRRGAPAGRLGLHVALVLGAAAPLLVTAKTALVWANLTANGFKGLAQADPTNPALFGFLTDGLELLYSRMLPIGGVGLVAALVSLALAWRAGRMGTVVSRTTLVASVILLAFGFLAFVVVRGGSSGLVG